MLNSDKITVDDIIHLYNEVLNAKGLELSDRFVLEAVIAVAHARFGDDYFKENSAIEIKKENINKNYCCLVYFDNQKGITPLIAMSDIQGPESHSERKAIKKLFDSIKKIFPKNGDRMLNKNRYERIINSEKPHPLKEVNKELSNVPFILFTERGPCNDIKANDNFYRCKNYLDKMLHEDYHLVFYATPYESISNPNNTREEEIANFYNQSRYYLVKLNNDYLRKNEVYEDEVDNIDANSSPHHSEEEYGSNYDAYKNSEDEGDNMNIDYSPHHSEEEYDSQIYEDYEYENSEDYIDSMDIDSNLDQTKEKQVERNLSSGNKLAISSQAKSVVKPKTIYQSNDQLLQTAKNIPSSYQSAKITPNDNLPISPRPKKI